MDSISAARTPASCTHCKEATSLVHWWTCSVVPWGLEADDVAGFVMSRFQKSRFTDRAMFNANPSNAPIATAQQLHIPGTTRPVSPAPRQASRPACQTSLVSPG
eukprot:c13566_g1_i1.p1 GENE.c13566_g1_i1~~c13566_g1_i1.p1  ORF type:complete len:104 (+),score=5.95 c13566_g1_i1:289-600(+)